MAILSKYRKHKKDRSGSSPTSPSNSKSDADLLSSPNSFASKPTGQNYGDSPSQLQGSLPSYHDSPGGSSNGQRSFSGGALSSSGPLTGSPSNNYNHSPAGGVGVAAAGSSPHGLRSASNGIHSSSPVLSQHNQPSNVGPGSATNLGGPMYPHPSANSSPLKQAQLAPSQFPSNSPKPAGAAQTSSAPQYPWTQRTVSNASPFPRYGHAANYVAARDGEVFVMGGLKGSNVFGDLWVIETGKFNPSIVTAPFSNIDTLMGFLLDTQGCPSPRVGHAALTLGNAFIVFGGDTKIEESDVLDDNLYLLNTTTLKWTVANPSGSRPSGRYGHTISTIGSNIYVFGGQLDDYFFDDLHVYDLTTLRSPTSKWTHIHPSTSSPPPRTNHTMVTYQDKLYLFGGTDGKLWYSDTWCFDPRDSSWTLLECTGFIPAPCEGHSATIVGDIMYTFGGRSSQGKDLGSLCALKLTTRKWFTFQNMGPGPSPRSGHSMTAFAGHKILVMGGESPDFALHGPESDQDSSNTVYVLDTSRISYPPPPVENVANSNPVAQKSTSLGISSPPSSTAMNMSGTVPHEVRSPEPAVASKAKEREELPELPSYASSNDASPPEPAYHRSSYQGPVPIVPVMNPSTSPVQVYPSPKDVPRSKELTPSSPPLRDSLEEDGENESTTTYESVPSERDADFNHGDIYSSAVDVSSPNRPKPTVADLSSVSRGRETPDITDIPGAWQPDTSNITDISNDEIPSSPYSVTTVMEDGNAQNKTFEAPVYGTEQHIGSSSPRYGSLTPQISSQKLNLDSPHSAEISNVTPPDPSEARQLGITGAAAAVVGGAVATAAVAANKLFAKSKNDGAGLSSTDKLSDTNNKELPEAAISKEAVVDHPTFSEGDQVSDVKQVLERLKASNSWYETELAIARDSGYVPSSRPPVDILKLRRVSQRITQDNSNTLSERDILVEALGDLKAELQSVQAQVQEQAELASEKISEVEQQRDAAEAQLRTLGASSSGVLVNGDANERVKELEAEIANLRLVSLSDQPNVSRDLKVSESEELTKPEILRLERKLQEENDRAVLAEQQIEHLKQLLASSKERVKVLSSSTEAHVASLAAAGLAITAAQKRSTDLGELVESHSKERNDLQNQISELQEELQRSQARVDTSEKELADQRTLFNSAKEHAEASSSALTSGIEKIATLWAGSKLFSAAGHKMSTAGDGDRELDDEDEDNEGYVALQNKLQQMTKLYESHKSAADKATEELSTTLETVSSLKAQLAEAQNSNKEMETHLNSTRTELDDHRFQLNEHKQSLGDISAKHAALESTIAENSTRESTRSQDTQKKIEEMQKEYEARYNSLESEYDRSLQYVQNTDKALTKTRDELNKYKDANTKLQADLDELKLRAQTDDDNFDSHSVNSAGSGGPRPLISSTKYNPRHVDLQLRDLRAQIIILQEERDELRANALDMKKKIITHGDDIKDAHDEINRLHAENVSLSKRAKEAEAHVSHVFNGNTDQTLDTFSNELDQIRNQRDKATSILKERDVKSAEEQ